MASKESAKTDTVFASAGGGGGGGGGGKSSRKSLSSRPVSVPKNADVVSVNANMEALLETTLFEVKNGEKQSLLGFGGISLRDVLVEHTPYLILVVRRPG
jgi:hypothetical protein